MNTEYTQYKGQGWVICFKRELFVLHLLVLILKLNTSYCHWHLFFFFFNTMLHASLSSPFSITRLNFFLFTRIKTVDNGIRALWLATQSVNILQYSLIHLQFLRVSDAKHVYLSYEQTAFQVCCRNKQKQFTTNGKQASCSRNTRRRWRSSVWKF